MPHPSLVNKTGYEVEMLLLADEDGLSQVVPCIQATFALDSEQRLRLLDEQPAVVVGGRWRGDPATTSPILEPQVAFAKPGTDIVLLGHAHAPRPSSTEGTVGLRLGPVQKLARVFGDRHFASVLGKMVVTAPQPFERIPITYERAFGGWDRHDPDPSRHRCEARNPVGVGFRTTVKGAEDVPLPNFEDGQQLLQSWGGTPPPAGFGFIAANWQPRLGFAGSYGEAWSRDRKPLLPADFDRRFFNAASPGLIATPHLRGDEEAVVIGCAANGRTAFRLPGLPPPACVIEMRGRPKVILPTALDTVVIDMDAQQISLTWRASLATRNGVHDVLTLEVHGSLEAASTPIVAVT